MVIDRFVRWDKPHNVDGDEDRATCVTIVDYYNRPFALFHEELERSGYEAGLPHPIRARFWGLLPYRVYEPREGRPVLLRYLDAVEHELASVIRGHSIAYWLHVYRRLALRSIGVDHQPFTVGLVRATLEAAIQKYGTFKPCSGVGITGDVSISAVLNGLLVHPDFEPERGTLEQDRQLVLTNFGPVQLREFYDAERLAYEVWRSSAELRALGKGASLEVGAFEECVLEVRSDELARLIRVFDERLAKRNNLSLSATGVVFADTPFPDPKPGTVFVPTYNLGRLTSDDYKGWFEQIYEIAFAWPLEFNFVWLPFNLRDFRVAHLPFADAFEQKHNVKVDAVLAVIVALCHRVLYIWTESKGIAITRFWQRAYEGPYTRRSVLDEIRAFLPRANQVLALDAHAIRDMDISKAARFLELDLSKQSEIDLAYPGPHSIFLPYGGDRLFIDYTWIIRRLYRLFAGVQIPDQNFKGDALERIVRSRPSVLPVGPCKASDEKRQIDAAFDAGDRLVIVECRVSGWSIGFDRGQGKAIRYRSRLVERLLADTDEKAQWLATHPVGTNYDISRYRYILPLGVTPFVEYIPSLSPRYWVTDTLPRVMTPAELGDSLGDGTLASVSSNLVPVSQRNGTG